ncbi:MAG: hypothetical protein ACREDL_16130 [Bradyrhizobium sp.]
MAATNQERAGKAADLLRAGLAPFVEHEVHSGRWRESRAWTPRVFGAHSLVEDRPAQRHLHRSDLVGLRRIEGMLAVRARPPAEPRAPKLHRPASPGPDHDNG